MSERHVEDLPMMAQVHHHRTPSLLRLYRASVVAVPWGRVWLSLIEVPLRSHHLPFTFLNDVLLALLLGAANSADWSPANIRNRCLGACRICRGHSPEKPQGFGHPNLRPKLRRPFASIDETEYYPVIARALASLGPTTPLGSTSRSRTERDRAHNPTNMTDQSQIIIPNALECGHRSN